MYELIQLTEHDYYFNCPAKIGLVRLNDTDVILIDSGNDKDAGKKVFRQLEANGWKLKAVLNTHSHADHIGGNRFLQDKTGCAVYVRGIESAFTNYPLLEPVGLYGGMPIRDMKHKFLMAQDCRASELTEKELPEGIKMIDLPGHSAAMTGFITDDGTAYIGDCVSSEETLSKYGIGYMWDPGLALDTLKKLKTVEAVRFVPAHAPVTDDITCLAELNIAAVNAVFDTVKEICTVPTTFEEILADVFERYSLQMTAQQYALIGSTLRGYLGSLYETGSVTFEFCNNKMLWRSVSDGNP